MRKTKTYQEIGKKFGISGERVRQVIQGEERKESKLKYVQEQYIKNLDKILKANLFDEIERLSGRDRSADIVMQRRALVRKLKDEYGFSFREIAFVLKRDHTTIIHLYYERGHWE